MSSNIFINYRRDDSSGSVGRLYDRLSAHFPENQIFIDVDNLAPGVDFVEALEQSVGSCEVLIAVIGRHWLSSSDGEGNRRLDNPDDFVRIELGNALKRNIRVIPVLVDGASMPQSRDLPDDLKALARRNAIEVSHTRFHTDSERLIVAVERILEAIQAREQREKERLEVEQRERERLAAERRQREEKERREGQTQTPPTGENENTELPVLPIVALQQTQTPRDPKLAIPVPESKTPPIQARNSPIQAWICRIDRLSWLPFAAVVTLVFWKAIQYWSYWMTIGRRSDAGWGLLLLSLLPSSVMISSFFNYPKRRILEVIGSLIYILIPAYLLLYVLCGWTLGVGNVIGLAADFFMPFSGNVSLDDITINSTWLQSTILILAVLGVTMKIWPLIRNRRNSTAGIAKGS